MPLDVVDHVAFGVRIAINLGVKDLSLDYVLPVAALDLLQQTSSVLQGWRSHHLASLLEGFQQHFEISSVRKIHRIQEWCSQRIGIGQAQMALTSGQQQRWPNDDAVLPSQTLEGSNKARCLDNREAGGKGRGEWHHVELDVIALLHRTFLQP